LKLPFLPPNRLISIPQTEVSPTWYLAWGNVDAVTNGVTWRDRSFVIINASPTLSPNERFVLIGDIWLSNRSKLLQQLDINPKEATDSQIVAVLWERWGVESLMLLEGMFSLAVWDRERQELWLGRDRVGTRTLYYTTSGGTRWIAPRLRTLRNHHSTDLDLVAMRDYLCCAFVPGERTLWQQVHELPPGATLHFPSEKLQFYWQLKEQITNTTQPIEWHGEKLRSLLNQIVQEYLPINEPVGVYLSGGLDSSCITALAAKIHNQPVHTYSIHFGSDYPNELEFSSLIAQHCQTQHHILEIPPTDLWEQLPKTMVHLDDPIGDPLTVPNLLVGELARKDVEIILNGEGGDPCFAGPKNKPMLLNSLYGSVSPDQPDLVATYLNSFQKCANDLPRLFNADTWSAISTEPSVFAPDLYADTSYLNRLMLLNIKFKGSDQILTKVNNLTTAAALHGRSPLFDQRIVEFSLQIPPEYKLLGADEKAVLKQAVADLLPEAILKRPKSGMMVPVQKWFREIWRPQGRALLLNKKAVIASYCNQSLIRDWLNYRGDAWSRYGVKLWLLVSLEIWLQVNN
jgi:asparagine synthase (glutamine-hydrolysing)